MSRTRRTPRRTSRRTSRRTRAGMTLLEVVISVGILGMMLAVLVPAITSSLQMNATDRVRETAISATNGWLDRFRAKTLSFAAFEGGRDFPRGYDYAADAAFVAAGDPDPETLNTEWSAHAYTVRTTQVMASPLVWRVAITTRYQPVGAEGQEFHVETLVKQ